MTSIVGMVCGDVVAYVSIYVCIGRCRRKEREELMIDWNAGEYKVSTLCCTRARWQVSMCLGQVSRRNHQHVSHTSAYDRQTSRETSGKSDACRRMCIAEAQGIYTSQRLSMYRVGFGAIIIVQTLALQQAFRVASMSAHGSMASIPWHKIVAGSVT
jgi:hypothetical protein